MYRLSPGPNDLIHRVTIHDHVFMTMTTTHDPRLRTTSTTTTMFWTIESRLVAYKHLQRLGLKSMQQFLSAGSYGICVHVTLCVYMYHWHSFGLKSVRTSIIPTKLSLLYVLSFPFLPYVAMKSGKVDAICSANNSVRSHLFIKPDVDVGKNVFVLPSVMDDFPVSYTHLTLPTICSV